MKKSLILVGMLSIGYAYAQSTDPYEGKVGINTDIPSATLNVKSKTGTTSTTKNFELENANGTKMVTVLDNGKMGVGTDTPEANVDIKLNEAGMVSPLSIRNLNTASRNNISLNTGGTSDTGRNTLGFALTGKDYSDSNTPSFSGNNAVMYSTTTNGLNFQVHQKDAKFKFYNGGVGEGALTMSILPKRVQINTTELTSASLTLGTSGISNEGENKENKIALISSSVDGENVISYYDSNNSLDAQVGIGAASKEQFQVKIFDNTKHFGIYEHGATRFTLNNGFARIGRQSGTIPSMFTIDGYPEINDEQLGVRLQSTQTTSTYATMYFDRKEEGGGMRFKVSHNKHGYQFDTNRVESALKIQALGNVGIGINEPTNKLHIKANTDPLKLEGLQSGTGEVLVIDANGVVKKGSGAVTEVSKVASTNALQCNAENRGKMNFIPNDNGSDVFGICLRNKDGNYYWGYMVGGNNPTNGTGAFGSGL